MGVVLDSDAVIGFLDRGDALHERAESRVRELLRDGEALLASVVTFAEVLTGARRGHHPEDSVRGFFEDLLAEIVPVEIETAERAAELRGARPSLRMPDALILATADVRPDVELLIGGDREALRTHGVRFRLELLGRASR